MSGDNPTKGELTLTMEGFDYTLRPSREAVMAIEKLTRKSVIELYNAATELKLTLNETAFIVAELVKAWGIETGDQGMQRASAERFTTLVYEHGLHLVCARIATVLGLAATGGVSAEGKVKPKTAEAIPGA
jgi:hypothetical protein